MIKIAAVSDLHGHLPKIPDCDLLLIAGDICPDFVMNGKIRLPYSSESQYLWLDKEFRVWLNNLDCDVVGCAGNHDWAFYDNLYPTNLNWTYLKDSHCTINGLKIYGSPWQREFHNWAFNLKEEHLDANYDMIPDDTDILLTHGPPYGFGDQTPRGELVGSKHLIDRTAFDIKPKLHVFGHIHHSYGEWLFNNTIMANVSLCDEKYRPVNKIKIWEIEI